MTDLSKFDRLAKVWCKHCGTGDSIRCKRVLHREESFDVDDIDSPDVHLGDTIHESVESQTYWCGTCGAESDDLSELATDSQNEAIETYNKVADTKVKATMDLILKGQIWPMAEDEYYPDYEED